MRPEKQPIFGIFGTFRATCSQKMFQSTLKHLKKKHPENSRDTTTIEKMAISTNVELEKSSQSDSTSEELTDLPDISGKLKAIESYAEHIQIAKMIDENEEAQNTENGHFEI